MLLPLLAFVFGSLIVAAAAFALMPRKTGAIDRRLEELRPDREDVDEQRAMQSFVGFFKRVGERAPRSAEGARHPAAPPRAGRLSS